MLCTKRISIVFLLVIFLSCTTAPQKLDTTDKVLLGVTYASFVVDTAQTLNIVTSPVLTEMNPIIAGLATITPVLVPVYFIGCGIGAYYIAKHLKPKYRKVFLGSIIAIEAWAITNNFSHGVGIK